MNRLNSGLQDIKGEREPEDLGDLAAPGIGIGIDGTEDSIIAGGGGCIVRDGWSLSLSMRSSNLFHSSNSCRRINSGSCVRRRRSFCGPW